jgi:hypothetical protein
MISHGPQCECNTCDRAYCTCGVCDACRGRAAYIRDTTCACCKVSDDDSAAESVSANNGYCPTCRDAQCGEQKVGAPCRAVVS